MYLPPKRLEWAKKKTLANSFVASSQTAQAHTHMNASIRFSVLKSEILCDFVYYCYYDFLCNDCTHWQLTDWTRRLWHLFTIFHVHNTACKLTIKIQSVFGCYVCDLANAIFNRCQNQYSHWLIHNQLRYLHISSLCRIGDRSSECILSAAYRNLILLRLNRRENDYEIIIINENYHFYSGGFEMKNI